MGQFFEFRRLGAYTIVLKKTQEALFANDCTLLAQDEEVLQCIVNQFTKALQILSLIISLWKTGVMFYASSASNAISP